MKLKSILILLSFAIFVFVFGYIIFSFNNMFVNKPEPQYAVKKSLFIMNEIITHEKQFDDGINYDNIENILKVFLKRMPVLQVKYLKMEPYKIALRTYGKNPQSDTFETRETPYSEYSKKEIRDYNLSEYKGKPIITTTDGIMYMFYKFEKGCKTVDLDTPKNSSCLVDVDINGIKKPNNKKFNTKKPFRTDRYTFIIDGNNNTVLPAKIYHDMIYERNG